MDRRSSPYRTRFADAELRRLLAAIGAVLIEGPRASGKTATARNAAQSEVRLDVDENARALGAVDPNLLLDGERPRLIDEWQLVPAVWNYVRRAVDDEPGPGQFILTGSAVPADDETRHSGAGRIVRMRLRPMSLAESGHSSGAASLASLMAGNEVKAANPGLSTTDVVERIVVGGWPRLIDSEPDRARVVLRAYLDETRRVDLRRVDGVDRDPEAVGRVIRSLARHVGTAASARAIATDVLGAEASSVKPHTVADYLEALARVFVLEDLPAWSPALRSRARLRAAPVRHFVDPSLAAAALNTGVDRLLGDLNTLGFLFESLVVRDLRVYAQAIDGFVYHYHDGTGLEADAIVELADGRWAAFEAKLGSQQIDAAAANLLRLAAKIDPDKHGKPTALAVITGSGYAYPRPDGVHVIPVGTLAP